MCVQSSGPTTRQRTPGVAWEHKQRFTKKEAFELTFESKILRADHIPNGEAGTGQETEASSVKDLDFIMSSILLETEEEGGMARDEHDQVSGVCIMKGLVCPRNRMKFHLVGQESPTSRI